MTDTEALRAAAEAALTEHPGGRAFEAHPFRPNTEAVLLNDEGDGIAEGDKAQIALCVAAQPRTILALLAVAEAAAKVRDTERDLRFAMEAAPSVRPAIPPLADALNAAFANLDTALAALKEHADAP